MFASSAKPGALSFLNLMQSNCNFRAQRKQFLEHTRCCPGWHFRYRLKLSGNSMFSSLLFFRMHNPSQVLNSIWNYVFINRYFHAAFTGYELCMHHRFKEGQVFLFRKNITENHCWISCCLTLWTSNCCCRKNYSKIRLPVKVRWPSNSSWRFSFGTRRKIEEVRQSPPLSISRTTPQWLKWGCLKLWHPRSSHDWASQMTMF